MAEDDQYLRTLLLTFQRQLVGYCCRKKDALELIQETLSLRTMKAQDHGCIDRLIFQVNSYAHSTKF